MNPQVGLIMGSDSDWDTVAPAAEVLAEFGVPFEVGVVSAHRTPEKMLNYAKSAHERGIRCIIACAGGAAHLPGMVAAATPLPVIGIPRALKDLDGLDSLLSIVQMPGGVPVATVSIGGAKNAGLLAVRILGAGSPELVEKMATYQANMAAEVEKKDERLRARLLGGDDAEAES
ncbi:5-(carboxyamino)imidazole ribonucleotide mutase [Corynebacterium uropygiale]|uniref:N5-carboxyaminoimidazole ribonucleotide mutase n=1 Tax=Corynebacterium uropygiale TaxID=1775911 RepID=A0A9X1QMK3_9CORY|nr:5-(carboxyamino)imidazole ribonucleotide mutase [Corynebacterium uropygiale]MCF4006039.1 5-(carboxyamino)imidazole ribonucleotide mutase [Corynebacterium uropygiale]